MRISLVSKNGKKEEDTLAIDHVYKHNTMVKIRVSHLHNRVCYGTIIIDAVLINKADYINQSYVVDVKRNSFRLKVRTDSNRFYTRANSLYAPGRCQYGIEKTLTIAIDQIKPVAKTKTGKTYIISFDSFDINQIKEYLK